jgi:hypothetical protein
MQNKISFTISDEALANIKNALKTMEENLPGLLNLTIDERRSLPKLGDKSFSFVTKNLEFAKSNPQVVPPFLDVTEFEIDVKAFNELNKVLNPLKQFTEKLDDTTMLSGSEAYSAALIFYNAVKSAAKAGVPGMKVVFEDLQARFPGHKGNPVSSVASQQ